mmetsp:Transcript_3271/g.11393  ORF Transcript_3271/g.11393 Transcript_3271/m.11393 type:complete len:259 (-) Transcript_3271:2247-3023(-)
MVAGSVNFRYPSVDKLTSRFASNAYATSRTFSKCARIVATGVVISRTPGGLWEALVPPETFPRGGEYCETSEGTLQILTVLSLDADATKLLPIQSRPKTQSRCPTSNAEGARVPAGVAFSCDFFCGASNRSATENTATSHGLFPPVANREPRGFNEIACMPQFSNCVVCVSNAAYAFAVSGAASSSSPVSIESSMESEGEKSEWREKPSPSPSSLRVPSESENATGAGASDQVTKLVSTRISACALGAEETRVNTSPE